jgi:hypothetical protein
MQTLGVFMGLLMGASLFMRWEAVIEGIGAVRVYPFLGIDFNSYFPFMGQRLDFIPIVLTVLFLVAIILAKKTLWKKVAFLAALFCLGIGVWDLLAFPVGHNLTAGIGLWIFTVASLLGAAAALSLLLSKDRRQPDSSSMPPSKEP